MALIHDEYGNFQGLVTPADVLEAIAGVFRSDTAGAGPNAVEREDGSWLLSGAMPADEMADMLGIRLPKSGAYETVAGFVLAHLQHLPETGEHIEASGLAVRGGRSRRPAHRQSPGGPQPAQQAQRAGVRSDQKPISYSPF